MPPLTPEQQAAGRARSLEVRRAKAAARAQNSALREQAIAEKLESLYPKALLVYEKSLDCAIRSPNPPAAPALNAARHVLEHKEGRPTARVELQQHGDADSLTLEGALTLIREAREQLSDARDV